jgi:drug/metabolite transporter (DMT)-like permease
VTEPSAAADAKVNGLSIAALVVGVVSIFFNPYLLVSVIAIVLGIIAVVRAQQTGNQRTYRLIAILGVVAGAVGAVLVIVSNTISALP